MIALPFERQDRIDEALSVEAQTPGVGEYLGAKVRRGFDYTTLRMGIDAVRTGMAEREAYGLGDTRPEYNLGKPELWGPDGYDPLRPYRMDEDTWKKSEFYREGIAYTPKMTRVRASILAEDFDKRRERDQVIDRSPLGGRSILGFGAELIGGLADPINLLPLGLAGKGGTMAARAGWAALDGAVGTALTDALVIPDLKSRGEDVGFADAANDIMFGAVIGAGMGAAGKVIGDRMAAKQLARETAHLRDRQTAGRALEKAVSDIAADRPVDVSGVLDSVEGSRMASRAIQGESAMDLTPEMPEAKIEPIPAEIRGADELSELANAPEVRMVQDLEAQGVLTEDDVAALRDAGRADEMAAKIEEAGLSVAECIAGAAI